MDIWKQVRDIFEGLKTPSPLTSKVDYEGLIAELKRVAYAKRREIGERIYVPCDYLVELSPRDTTDMVESNFTALMQDALQKAMEGHIRERKYLVQGAVTVRLGANDELGDGYVAVTVNYAPFLAQAHSPQTPSKTLAGEDLTVIQPLRGASGMGAYLEVIKGDVSQQGKTIGFTVFPAQVGRITQSQKPPIGLVDATNRIGREHAIIDCKRGVFTLEDRSQNGTWVGGVKLKTGEVVMLNEGTEVSLADGAVVLRFHSGDHTVLPRGLNSLKGFS